MKFDRPPNPILAMAALGLFVCILGLHRLVGLFVYLTFLLFFFVVGWAIFAKDGVRAAWCRSFHNADHYWAGKGRWACNRCGREW